MACGGIYDTANPLIVAVGPAYYSAWPCGTPLRVCGAGGCVDAFRSDSCPGCGPYLFDMSESGLAAVCGAVVNCAVTVEVLR